MEMNHKHLSIAITHCSESPKKEQDYQSMKLLEYENFFSNSHRVKKIWRVGSLLIYEGIITFLE